MRNLRNTVVFAAAVIAAVTITLSADAQGFRPEPVFSVGLQADRSPIVAGDELRLAVVINIDEGWHINTDDPGDEFMVPTSLEWQLPEGWPEVGLEFPQGEAITFDFSETPLSVWEGKAVMVGTVLVPADAVGAAVLAVSVTAAAKRQWSGIVLGWLFIGVAGSVRPVLMAYGCIHPLFLLAAMRAVGPSPDRVPSR